MNYKNAKYFRQNLDLSKIMLRTNFYFIYQLKAIKILDWVLLKREFVNQNFKIRVLPIKLFKNNILFNWKLLHNIHTGNILIVYYNKLYLDNMNIPFTFEKNNIFLIPLYILLNKRYYLFKDLRILLQSNHIKLIKLMLHSHSLIKVLLNKNI